MVKKQEQKAQVIGIVSNEFTNPYTLTLLNELTRQLNERGCITLLLNVNSRDSYQTALQTAAQLHINGLIFLDSISGFGEQRNSKRR